MAVHGAGLFGSCVSPDVSARSDWEVLKLLPGATASGHQATPGNRNNFRQRYEGIDPDSLATPGGMIAAGVGGPVTGKGGDIIVIDDPVKNREEAESQVKRDAAWAWYCADLYTRLEPDGGIVLLQTRWHEDDLAGRIKKKARNELGDDEPWYELRLPAIAGQNDPMGRDPGEALWPQRFTADRLQQIERAIGPYDWSALYQQNPRPHSGLEWDPILFEDRWFYDWPVTKTRVVALDPSLGRTERSDYSAIIYLGLGVDGLLYVDADIKRRSTGDMVADLVQGAREFRSQHVTVEGNLFQALLEPLILEESRATGWPVPCELVCNMVNKEIRIRRLGPWIRQDLFRYRRTPGVKILIEQLSHFPAGAHDDGPDSLEMALRVMNDLYGVDHEDPVGEAMRITYS